MESLICTFTQLCTFRIRYNISNAQVFQLPRSEYFRFYVLISLFNYYIIRLFVDIDIAVLNFILSNSYS